MTSNQGFPREIRLRSTEDHDRVHGEGRRFRMPHLDIRYLRHGQETARFGLSVGRKVGNAVARNRVKRWLREAIRRGRTGLVGVDVVIVAKPGALEAGGAVLESEVAESLARIRSAR